MTTLTPAPIWTTRNAPIGIRPTISFASKIGRDKASIAARDYQITALVEEHKPEPIMGETDNLARMAIEGNHNRADVRREFRGV